MNKVKLDTGYITGTKLNQAGREIYLYKGIPYAAPPIGELRWKPPQPAASWSGVRACTEFSTQAAQYPDPNSPEAAKKMPSSEDCLYLNVLTPAKKTTDKLPVMVWLHGGGLRYGNGNFPLSVQPRAAAPRRCPGEYKSSIRGDGFIRTSSSLQGISTTRFR